MYGRIIRKDSGCEPHTKGDFALKRVAAFLLAVLLSAAVLPALSDPEGTPSDASAPGTFGYVCADSVNFRSGPFINSERIARLKKYALCVVYGTETGADGSLWYRVGYGGATGYLNGDCFRQMTAGETEAFLISPEYQEGIANNADTILAAAQGPDGGYEPFEPFATPEPELDFTYHILEDGTVELLEQTYNQADVIIPEEFAGRRVTVVGTETFYKKKSLKTVVIPEGVTGIGDLAFGKCPELTRVVIPESVSEIGVNPFLMCENLTDIIISPESRYLAKMDDVVFRKADDRLVCYPVWRTAARYDIPPGTRIIGAYAFAGCGALREVTVPDSVTAIGKGAFIECGALEKISIPESVALIGDYAFKDCPDVTVTVTRNSYAAAWCREHGIDYAYTDAGGRPDD